MFLLGGAFAMIIRAELFQPGMQLIQPEFFNQMTTMHGLVMVFGAIMPAFVGLANWMIPMMIGAPDMAFWRPYYGSIFNNGIDQYHSDRYEYAGSWHDLHEDATICLDMGNHCVSFGGCNASTSRCSYYDVDGH